MIILKIKIHSLVLILILNIISCNTNKIQTDFIKNNLPANILDYAGTPVSAKYRGSLTFSDQGAWFAYGFPIKVKHYGGFKGPFLMTQENGVWSSSVLSRLQLTDCISKKPVEWNQFKISQTSYHSHLEQIYRGNQLNILQKLFFSSPHTAMILTQIKNLSNHSRIFKPHWAGSKLLENLHFSIKNESITINSDKSKAIGFIKVLMDSFMD
jgi:putative isomerase